MNIEQAKSIKLADILEKLGNQPARMQGKEMVFLSPLRDERTPSFFVNESMNVWFDHGTGEGGGILEFAIAFLKSRKHGDTVSDALRFLSNMGGFAPFIKPVSMAEERRTLYALEKRDETPIQHPALIEYLDKRGIPLNIAANYLVQLRVFNSQSKKNYFALGMANEDDGHEIRTPYFKGSVGPKAITFIRGSKVKPPGIHLFEGMFDFLTTITYRNVPKLEDDAIILHSVANLKQATPYIKGYGYNVGYTWFDNDKAGDEATRNVAAFFKTEQDLIHKPMNASYQPYKDVNAWFCEVKHDLNDKSDGLTIR